ncbi:hypothetical protein RIF29_08030 [Crotalaria pallida]|uniref:Uncharacterized protein n=1 Tax=Crotalaria pallida TaxID=3830 RepID=A0AAN9J542_CROPI
MKEKEKANLFLWSPKLFICSKVEWWKKEYSHEIAKKKKKKQLEYRNGGGNSDNDLWVRDDDLYSDVNGNKCKTTKHSRKNSGGSVDSWFGEASEELRRVRRNSFESAGNAEIPKSSGLSTATNMRRTIFYVAPEYGYIRDVLSYKCDVRGEENNVTP